MDNKFDINKDELRRKIDLYLDNALDPADHEVIREFVNTNPEYQKLFHTENTFRQFVKNNIARPSVSPDFVNQLKHNLQNPTTSDKEAK